ncbi:hypothetical protein GCM10009819_35140 [Agromyces tropicus]|uniref:ABC transporter n=1 Tax=Agromyces tropicus TaxID=555371 RepID=A0ABN2UXM9_9MICO
MSSTTPGSEPGRGDLDGDGRPDASTEPETAADAPSPDAPPDVEAQQAAVEPTAPDAEHVDRLEPADAAPASDPVDAEEHAFTGTDADAAAADDADPVPTEPGPAERSDLDAAVERARTEHPPVDGDTAVVDERPEPVRAEEVGRETGVPETVGAGAVAGAAAGAAAAPEAPAPPMPQTIYVQAPAPPRERGNRGFGILVGLIATVGFALLYAAVSFLVILGQNGGSAAGRVFGQFAAQPVFWIPVLFFFLAFALLAAILNRAAWWTWAVFGLAIGIIVYFSYIAGALLTVAAWQFTPEQAADFIRDRWLDPYAIIAAVVARELPIWFGGWIAAHGRTVTERNVRAREEYDRRIAAGPQPVSSTR